MTNLTAKLKTVIASESGRYLFFGVLTTALSILLYELFIWMGASAAVSNTLATAVAIVFAFLTNKRWVFNSLDYSRQTVWPEFYKFVSGRLFTFFAETSALYILVDRLFFHKTLTKIVTTACVVVLNYAVSKFLVFQRRK